MQNSVRHLEFKNNPWCSSIYITYITIVIVGLNNVEMDSEIFSITRIQMKILKVTQNYAWPWSWRLTVDVVVFIVIVVILGLINVEIYIKMFTLFTLRVLIFN